jgi:hypothetical protein
MEQDRIEIKLSKAKGILIFFGAVVFMLTSIWLINFAPYQDRFEPVLVTVTGYIGAIFFGLAALYIFYKLFDSKPGLVIDKDGIYDNSSAAAGHLIKWERITGLRVEQVMSTKFILVDIENPEEFMKEVHGVKKKLMWSTYKMYGTPTSISSSTLSCDFDELLNIINSQLDIRKKGVVKVTTMTTPNKKAS